VTDAGLLEQIEIDVDLESAPKCENPEGCPNEASWIYNCPHSGCSIQACATCKEILIANLEGQHLISRIAGRGGANAMCPSCGQPVPVENFRDCWREL
jgi:rhodanese-related sulfurtransferase